jgi:hypothetical protein
MIISRTKLADLANKNKELEFQLQKCNNEQYAQIENNIENNIEKYPSLSIDFPQKYTEHQKKAVKIAANFLKWHPVYVSEFCCALRPCLYHNKYSDIHWEEKTTNYQKEHDLSVEDLSQVYISYFENKCAYRVYEPWEWENGFRVMAQDVGINCPALNWDDVDLRQSGF